MSCRTRKQEQKKVSDRSGDVRGRKQREEGEGGEDGKTRQRELTLLFAIVWLVTSTSLSANELNVPSALTFSPSLSEALCAPINCSTCPFPTTTPPLVMLATPIRPPSATSRISALISWPFTLKISCAGATAPAMANRPSQMG